MEDNLTTEKREHAVVWMVITQDGEDSELDLEESEEMI